MDGYQLLQEVIMVVKDKIITSLAYSTEPDITKVFYDRGRLSGLEEVEQELMAIINDGKEASMRLKEAIPTE